MNAQRGLQYIDEEVSVSRLVYKKKAINTFLLSDYFASRIAALDFKEIVGGIKDTKCGQTAEKVCLYKYVPGAVTRSCPSNGHTPRLTE